MVYGINKMVISKQKIHDILGNKYASGVAVVTTRHLYPQATITNRNVCYYRF